MVQYFQHDLFRSIARTLYFQGLFVVHQHFGRHSSVNENLSHRYFIDFEYFYIDSLPT